MIWSTWRWKEIALVAAILTLACAAAFLSIKLTRPKPFASMGVTQPWQCIKSAGHIDVCVRKHG